MKQYGPQSKFANDIMLQKYSMDGKESWEDIARRVVKHVMGALDVPEKKKQRMFELIRDRIFMPGGRYLYASGRPFHQVQNCLLMRAEDSREGWAKLMHNSGMALMTGAGIGVDYSDVREEGSLITKTGGVASGPISLMNIINETGRHVMQGGSRRSAIWAGLNWNHPDVLKFVRAKDWSEDIKKLKAKDFNFPAPLDMTNISVILKKEFFDAYKDKSHPSHSHANAVYWETVRHMLETSEPGFSIDYDNPRESLRNACVTGDTTLITKQGIIAIEDLIDTTIEIWNGFEWSEVEPKITGENQNILKIKFDDGREINCTPYHKFHISTNYTGGVKVKEASELKLGDKLIKCSYPIIYEGKEGNLTNLYTQGFYSADGNKGSNVINFYGDKIELACYMNVRQIGNEYENSFGTKKRVFKTNFQTNHKDWLPFDYEVKGRLAWLSGLLDGDGCELKEGGCQIASVDRKFLSDVQSLLTTLGVNSKLVPARKAGYRKLPTHQEAGDYKEYYCKEMHRLCIGAVEIQELKTLGLECKRLSFDKLPQRNAGRFARVISIEECGKADLVYCFNEPKRHLGVFGGVVTGQCTEVTSEDDSDICNLGSINMGRIDSIELMAEVVELGTLFLLCGTVYSDVPYAQVDVVRTKNRRLGLGLMGIHEFLLKRGLTYDVHKELDDYLSIYQYSTAHGNNYAAQYNLSPPVKTRAIAPTGTIGIIAETTTGCEPIFCAAYKRRYLKGKDWHYQYYLDNTAKQFVEQGISPDAIEDAYSLDTETRVKFQAHLQKYVDHGISSTINIPKWGSAKNNDSTIKPIGDMLMKYLPELRGITFYADGSRGGQPLTPVKYSYAVKHYGKELKEDVVDVCDLTKGGSCNA